MNSKSIVALAALALALPALASAADGSPKEEKFGVGGGLLVGAAAGGPIGMIVGAAIGGLLGDRMHRQKSDRDDYARRYEAATRDVESLEALLQGSERDIAELRQSLNSQASGFRDALRETLAAEIYFHTGESAIDTRTEERLARISSVVSLIDDFAIVIEGHADARGDATYNEQLSAERAEAVRNVLVTAGIPADRITSRAAGETLATAAEDDLDSLALERRVQINLVYPDSERRVARQ